MVSKPSLPASVREVAILVTGAHFRSAYELYAHVMVGRRETRTAGRQACNNRCRTTARKLESAGRA